MMTFAGLIAALAAVVQVAALATAANIIRCHRFRVAAAAILGALGLMALRRLLATVSLTGLADTSTLPLLAEFTGLATSALVMIAALGTTAAGAAKALGGMDDQVETALTDVAAGREEERELLCYDLHDGLSQLVQSARMHLEAFCAAREEDSPTAEQELALLSQRLTEAVEEVSRVVSRLAVGISPEVPLSEAVKHYLSKLSESEGWEFEFDDRLQGRRFAPPIEAMTSRVVQEALTNAAKHAHTQRVRVSLYIEERELVVVVQDWGRGFDPDQVQWKSRQLGLKGMCNRARLIGGRCNVESRPGEGTTVIIRIPGVVPGGESA